MIMNKFDMHRLNRLINLYFEGLTTLDQEQELRRMLDDPSANWPEALEARAVLSYASVSPVRGGASGKRNSLRPLLAAVSAAAVIAIVSVVGWHFTSPSAAVECIAYVDGRPVNDSQAVMGIIESDLSMLGDASSDVSGEISSELNAISNAINSENTTL